MYSTSFIKYFYIFILFCVVFFATYNYVTEAVGFKFLAGLNGLYLVIFLFQILNDGAKQFKSLRIDIPETRFSNTDHINLPFYLVILPSLIMQLIASVLTLTTTEYLQNKYNMIKLTRNDRYKLNMYKWMAIIATISVTFLVYSYCSDFNTGLNSSNFAGSYKTLLLLGYLSSILFPLINLYLSKELSKLKFSSTE